MSNDTTPPDLRIGFVGAGFIARFHLLSLVNVRRCRLSAIFSPSAASRNALTQEANELDLGPCNAYATLEELVDSGEVDAIWILGPNDTRVDTVRRICSSIEKQRKERGKSSIIALACEKPLARTVLEAEEMLMMVEDCGLLHGYLENQVYAPSMTRGRQLIYSHPSLADPHARPYLSRTAEEHAGPHKPWFWSPSSSGGGVLLDMMCHSAECARWLLTKPGEPRDSLTIKKISATTATLKWSRKPFAEKLKGSMGVSYGEDTGNGNMAPTEDFARATITLEDTKTGHPLVVECTTSWCYVGVGLRLLVELQGPEYSMEINTQQSDLKLFFSGNMKSDPISIGGGGAGEELIEKANASSGLLPTIASEAFTYGYISENMEMVSCFRNGKQPSETWKDGVEVVKVLMGMYLSAEENRTVMGEELESEEIRNFVPSCARA